jgi:transcriptional regulator with XRE-family HTH domain
MNALNHDVNTDQASPPFQQIAALRQERGESLAEFAAAVGCSSKGRMSEIERGRASPTVAQALRLEELSGGRIDAGALNEDVRASRHAQTIKAARALVHSVINTVPEGDGLASSSAAVGEQEHASSSAAVGEGTRIIICDVCERRFDREIPNACTFVDCPHGQSWASSSAAVGPQGRASDSTAVGREKDAA